MDRRDFTAAGAAWALAMLTSRPALAAAISEADAASGIRAALEKGALAAVGTLGREGGFFDNPKLRIPLPGFLNDAAKLLRATGKGDKVDALVAAMNRAAELAVPQAKTLLVDAAKSISLKDALGIVKGGQTSVTDYFSGRTREPLGVKFLPIVSQATQKVALADKYNAVAGKAAAIGLVKQKDANLQQYVTGKALDGLYLMIGEEERKIRRDPVGTGSAILRKVFGA